MESSFRCVHRQRQKLPHECMMDAISWIALAVCRKGIWYLFLNRSSHQHKAVVVSFTPFISFHNHRIYH
uniref:Uncharacterized protein n=1 Tax=Populus trichocarpa TaxID=3694 RepID=U5GCD6_POPTR